MSTTYFHHKDGTLSSTRTTTSGGLSFNQAFGGGSSFWRSKSGLSSVKFDSSGIDSIGMKCGRRMTYFGSNGMPRK